MTNLNIHILILYIRIFNQYLYTVWLWYTNYNLFCKKEKKDRLFTSFLQAVLHHLSQACLYNEWFCLCNPCYNCWRITFHVHVLFLMNYINWFMYISIFTKSINLNVYQLFKTNPSYKILIWIQYKVWSCCNKWFNFKCEIYYKHVVFVLAM